MIEQRHIDLLSELGTEETSHSGRALYDHLKGTHDLLEKWGNPQSICVAGLFHSIYGTEYFKVQSASLSDRKHIAEVIGPEAEDLAFLFCTTGRKDFFTEINKPDPKLTDRTTNGEIFINASTLAALIEIEIANYLEQLRREAAPGRVIESMRKMHLAGLDQMSNHARAELEGFLEQFK